MPKHTAKLPHRMPNSFISKEKTNFSCYFKFPEFPAKKNLILT
jgi:hypothetical protein